MKKNNFYTVLFFLVLFSAFVFGANDSVQARVKIAFVINELSYRGVEVSTFDYAHFNETLLGNESIIINFDVHTDNEVRKKFATRFPGKFFDCMSREEMDYILEQEQADILYFQKPGHDDGIISKVCKNAVHAVFPQKIQPHGDVYAFISEWFLHEFPQLNAQCVPYMVRVEQTDENLRKELHIPVDAIVFGRHGGEGSFNVGCALDAVKQVASCHPDIYFLFLNTKEFCKLPNVIFLPKTTDMMYKAKFINTCDAMIHARWRGETFGLACAEFSIKNKPVITWAGPKERAHIELLADTGIYYRTKEELIRILTTFKKEPHKKWDVYSTRFSPELVMKKFDEVFIKPLIKDRIPQKKGKHLLFKATRNDRGGLNVEFFTHLQQIFSLNTIVIEGTESWQTFPWNTRRLLDQKLLFFFDCHWRESMRNKNSAVRSIPEELSTIAQCCAADTTTIVIDGIHLMDAPTLEAVYHVLIAKNYQFFVFNDTAISFPHADVFVAPVIRAMTVSWLCEFTHFARMKTLIDIFAAERIIGRIVASAPAYKEFNQWAPAPSFASRYYQLWKGLALLHQEEYQQAVIEFQQVISQGYNHWRLYWYLAQAWHKMGNSNAEVAMQYVVRGNPNFWGIADFRKDISY